MSTDLRERSAQHDHNMLLVRTRSLASNNRLLRWAMLSIKVVTEPMMTSAEAFLRSSSLKPVWFCYALNYEHATSDNGHRY